MAKTLTEAIRSNDCSIENVVFSGARVSHVLYPFLTGTITAVDRKLRLNRIDWDEPWLVASVFDTFNDLILIHEENCNLLDEQTSLGNETCPRCLGAGVIKIVSDKKVYPLLICSNCAGAKVVRKRK